MKTFMNRRYFMKAASLMGVMMGSGLMATSKTLAAKADKTFMPSLPADIAGDLSFSKAEYDRRYQGVRQAMAEQSLSALIVTGTREWHLGDLGNLKYLGVPLDWARTYMLLPIDKEPVLFNRVPGFPIFKELAGSGPPPLPQGPPTPIKFQTALTRPRPATRFAGDHAPSIAAKLTELGYSKARIGVVSMRNIPADIVLALQENLPDAQFVDAQHILMNMRYYKSAEEQLFMRRSGYIADIGFATAAKMADIGVNDLDIYFAVDKACAKAGGPVGGFHLLGSGPWGKKSSNMLLAPGSARQLKRGDMIIPEIGSDYKGYFTQLTIPIALGRPPDSFYKMMALCRKVYDFNLTQMRAGKRVWDVDAACNAFTKDVSNGEFGTAFGIQAGEHELTFWHDNFELKPGSMAYNQPFFLPLKKPGPPFHIFGDALMITEAAPKRLHQTPHDIVIK